MGLFEYLAAPTGGAGAAAAVERMAGPEETHWRTQQLAKATASPALYNAVTGDDHQASRADAGFATAGGMGGLLTAAGGFGLPFSLVNAGYQVSKAVGAATGLTDDPDERQAHRDMWGD